MAAEWAAANAAEPKVAATAIVGLTVVPSSSAAQYKNSTAHISCTRPTCATPPSARGRYQAKNPANMPTSDTRANPAQASRADPAINEGTSLNSATLKSAPATD